MPDPLTNTAGTCVVHLVWAPLGPGQLAGFLQSYRRYPAGSPHQLLVLFNGFTTDHDLSSWRKLLADVECEEIRLDCAVLDLTAYQQVAARFSAERYCFLNSYAAIRAEGWLAALERALSLSGIGLVGSSGSWGSIRSYNRFMLGLGGYYARVFPDRRAAMATLATVAARHDQSSSTTGHAPLRFARELLARSYGFRTFPAPHIRTSAFMIDAHLLGQLDMRQLDRKPDALRLESGRDSLTVQIERRGLRALVVGRNGRAYSCEEWPASRTCWQGDQENLLIADKQTMDYEVSDLATRTALSRYAWGEAADPRPPPQQSTMGSPVG